MSKKSLRAPRMLFLLVAAGLFTVVLLWSRLWVTGVSQDERSTTIDASPVSTPRADVASKDVEEEPTRTAIETTTAAEVRPETALLQDLPKAQLTRAPDCPLNDLRVSFKLEPRLTRSLHMGDRWVSPPNYVQVGAGANCIVEAGILGLNAEGKAVEIAATWQAADPDMVHVSEPGPGNTIKLTVVHPGKTTVEIASQGITKQLALHAVSYGGTLMVGVAQE